MNFLFVDIKNTLPAIMVERVSCVYGIILQSQFSVRTRTNPSFG